MKWTTALGAAAGVGIAAAIGTYALVLRPRHLRWGATDEEVGRPMPLDDRVKDPQVISTRAVTISARPDEVWLWLAQMGDSPRAGYYSYDWIERLMGTDVHNADTILPGLQDIKPGDALDRAGTMLVKAVEKGRWLVLGPPDDAGLWLDSTWCLALYPQGPETTRLVTRVRARINRWTPLSLLAASVMDPGVFAMERKMMLGIKHRAEAMAEERRAHTRVFEEVLLEAMKSA